MLKSTVIFPFLIIIYITHSAVSIPAGSGLSFKFGVGGDGGSKSTAQANVSAGADSNDKNKGKVGGSIFGNFSSESILKKLATFPVKLPTQLAKLSVKLPLKIAKLPITLTKDSAGLTLSTAKKTIQATMTGLSEVGSLNSKLASSVTSGTKALTGKMVRALADSNIFGIQISYDVLNWCAKKINEAVETSLKLITKSVAGVSKMTNETLKILRVKDIINLPGLKQTVDGLKDIDNWNMDMIYKNYVQLGNFIMSIINEHSDFFIPVFHKVLNVFLAITNGLQQIEDGGKMTGVSAKLGSWEFALGPLTSGSWHIVGPGGNTIQGEAGDGSGLNQEMGST